MPEPLKGVWTPVVTPYKQNLSPDPERLIKQCRWLLDCDCGLAVFGTNSEGNSLSVAEKIDLMDALIEAGLDPKRMMPGTGACALTDAVQLAAHVAKTGCGGALALPPFYYKPVSDDGIFAFFAELIERVGDARLKLYLYHIPPVAQVGFSLELIERLIKAYPETVLGMKDSSGDFEFTKRVMAAFPGWGIFPGNELNLKEAMELGAIGCISATCNVNPAAIVDLYKTWDQPGADEKQAAINTVRKTFAAHPVIPGMKAVIADALNDPDWARLRPPLLALDDGGRAKLFADLKAIGFSLGI